MVYLLNNILFCSYVEHGEYKGNLYGTSVESIKSVVNAGDVCILSPHHQVCI